MTLREIHDLLASHEVKRASVTTPESNVKSGKNSAVDRFQGRQAFIFFQLLFTCRK